MTSLEKRKYCEEHPAIGWHNIMMYMTAYIHGFEYGIEDYAIGKVAYGDASNPNCCHFFRRKITHSSDGSPYIRLPFGTVYLSDFFRTNQPIQAYSEDMKSLK